MSYLLNFRQPALTAIGKSDNTELNRIGIGAGPSATSGSTPARAEVTCEVSAEHTTRSVLAPPHPFALSLALFPSLFDLTAST
jgi:hypothetical protein